MRNEFDGFTVGFAECEDVHGMFFLVSLVALWLPISCLNFQEELAVCSTFFNVHRSVSDRVLRSLRIAVKYTIINALHLHKTALNLTRSKVNPVKFTRVVIASMSISRYINGRLMLRWL